MNWIGWVETFIAWRKEECRKYFAFKTCPTKESHYLNRHQYFLANRARLIRTMKAFLEHICCHFFFFFPNKCLYKVLLEIILQITFGIRKYSIITFWYEKTLHHIWCNGLNYKLKKSFFINKREELFLSSRQMSISSPSKQVFYTLHHFLKKGCHYPNKQKIFEIW